MYFLGIDLGTSSAKSLLIDAEGSIIAERSAALSVSRPQAGWSEQEPRHWWEAVVRAVDSIADAKAVELGQVKGIGLSGQMHGATLIDADRRVIRPAILWNDVRSAEECREFEEAAPRAREITGNIAMPGFTAPKLLWVKKHEPENFARIDKVLLPKDYVRYCLTGAFVSDMSDAAGTLWLDMRKRDWSDELLAGTGLTRTQMPALVEGSSFSGLLKRELLERWKMRGDVVIAGGGGDNAASACGIGAVAPGQGFVSLGTSGVLFVSNDRFRPNVGGAVHAFCHAIPDTWHQMGVTLSATDSLAWLSRLVGREPAALTAAVAERFKGPGEEIFLPYLSGERTPHNNAEARGSFAGLSHLSEATRLAQAVMEGVAFAFRDCGRVLAEAGTQIDRLFAVGGGSRSDLWLEMLATNLGMEIAVPDAGDFGGALGAAKLAICATTGAEPLAVCTAPKIARVVSPRSDLAAAYDAKYRHYRALYQGIEEARK